MATPASDIPKFLQDDEEILSPECRSLLQTLPSDKVWGSPYHLYQYNGFWYFPRILNSLLSIEQNFPADTTDILLTTPPKTGTTWLKMDLYMDDKDPDLSKFAAPRLFSTHIPFSSLPGSVTSSKCKIVYMSRNPKDTAISLWHFSNKVVPEENQIPLEAIVDKFCQGLIAYGPFWDHALEYWKASQEMPHNVLFLKFEEMKKHPGEQLRRLADFLGCPFTEDEVADGRVEEILKLCSFESLSKMEANQKGKVSLGIEKQTFFRKGEVGDSANYLSQEMIGKFDRITEEKFHGSNLYM